MRWAARSLTRGAGSTGCSFFASQPTQRRATGQQNRRAPTEFYWKSRSRDARLGSLPGYKTWPWSCPDPPSNLNAVSASSEGESHHRPTSPRKSPHPRKIAWGNHQLVLVPNREVRRHEEPGASGDFSPVPRCHRGATMRVGRNSPSPQQLVSHPHVFTMFFALFRTIWFWVWCTEGRERPSPAMPRRAGWQTTTRSHRALGGWCSDR